MLDQDKAHVLKMQQLEREGVQQLKGIDYDVTTPPLGGNKAIGANEASPRSAQMHYLLLESIEKIASEWLIQLDTLQKSAEEMKQQILTYMGRTKSDIDALHELGIKVAAEAARGQAVCKELRDGLEKIS